MWNNFRHTFTRSRSLIIGWGLSLAIYSTYMAGFFDTLIGMKEQFISIAENYPPELIAFVGGVDALFSPAGFLNTYLFSYMPLILGILTILAGSGLLASDEESGTLDLVLGHPISRSRLFIGRMLAFVTTLITILGIIWLGILAGITRSTISFTVGQLLLPFLSLLAVLLFFGTLALLLSMVLPSRNLAASLTGLVLVLSFFLGIAANMDPNLETISKFSPLYYYQGGFAIDGMKWDWLVGLISISVIFTAVALWRFEGRDVRIAGEGGFGLPGLPFRRKRTVGDTVETT